MPMPDGNADALDGPRREMVASLLPEVPETAISLHVLRTGDGIARTLGDPGGFRAALVGWNENPGWLQGYGDPESIVELLAGHGPWTAVCVATADGEAVAFALTDRTGRPSRLVDEVYFELGRPVDGDTEPARELGPDDLPALTAAAAELDVGDPRATLATRIVAGVVDDDRVVSLSLNEASSARYGDIGVATLDGYRRRGFATACGRLVAGRVQAAGRRPVWCTGADNPASLRTAAAIGFREVGRRVNVFPG